MLIKHLKAWLEDLGLKKENIIPLSASLGIGLLVFIDSNYLNNRLLDILWILIGIFFATLLLVIMIKAGVTVIKTLFLINAELTFLIFLTQSYCAAPHPSSSNAALASLLTIGFLYLLYEFFHSLYKSCAEQYNSIKREKSRLMKAVIVGSYLLYAGFFVWAVYLVTSPIVLDFCIVKS